MVLLIHIAIALASIVASGVSFVRPTRRLIQTTYVSVAATLTTGTYLTLINPTHLPAACASGLAYLAVVGTFTIAAQRKLAKLTAPTR